jgi:predicted neutral ceramidase superfamily lipid hydrolase
VTTKTKEKKQTVIRQYKHHFKAAELQKLGQELADAWDEYNAAEAEKKANAAKLNDRIAEAKKVIQEKSSQIRSGYEHRDVECEVRKDLKAGKVKYVRLDNGRLHSERELSKEETQGELYHN